MIYVDQKLEPMRYRCIEDGYCFIRTSITPSFWFLNLSIPVRLIKDLSSFQTQIKETVCRIRAAQLTYYMS